jgi:TonB family protein
MQGQAGPKDLATAVGWLTAAADNGYRGLAPEKLAALRGKLTAEQRKTAEDIASHYGRLGLQNTALPIPPASAHCNNLSPAHVRHSEVVDSAFYPRSGRYANKNGFVIVQFTIGVDGVVRDPEILMAVPTPDFSAAAVEYWMQARFDPAVQDGVPVESKVFMKNKYEMTGGSWMTVGKAPGGLGHCRAQGRSRESHRWESRRAIPDRTRGNPRLCARN